MAARITKKTLIKTDDLYIYTETLTRHCYAAKKGPAVYVNSLGKLVNEILQKNPDNLSISTVLRLQALKAKRRPKRKKFESRLEKKKDFVRSRLALTKGKIKRLQNLEKKLKKSLKYYEKKT